MKPTQRIAVCGVTVALATVVLLMTVFPYATYAFAAFAGMLMIPVTLECGVRYGVLAYVATALLAFLLTPDFEAKTLFVLFFGYYPLVHLRLQRCRNKWLSSGIKLMLFNVAAIADFLLMTRVMNVPSDEFIIAGVFVPWVLLIAGNVLLVVYDLALTRVGVFYRIRIHPILKRLWM